MFVAEAEDILSRLEQAERLVTTQRDLGLATIRVGTFASPDLTLTLLLEEDYRVLVASESSCAGHSEIDLADADWICSRDENAASDRVLRRACHLAGFEPHILMRTDDLNMIHGLVAEGLGCTLATQAAVDTRFPVVTRPTTRGLGLRRRH